MASGKKVRFHYGDGDGGRLRYRLRRWNWWLDVLCRAVEVLRRLRSP